MTGIGASPPGPTSAASARRPSCPTRPNLRVGSALQPSAPPVIGSSPA
jgi:hypothetical protein